MTTVPELSLLAKLCKGTGPTHLHEKAWGSRKVNGIRHKLSAAAAAYPMSLCIAWAQALRSCHQRMSERSA